MERLKEFGITKKMIVEHGAKTMRGIELVNNKGQIVDQENFNKTLFSLMNEKYAGGMEKQAHTFKGAMSTIKGVMSTTLASIAGVADDGTVVTGGLLDNLKTKIVEVTGKIQQWANNGGMKKVQTNISNALKHINQGIDFFKRNSKTIIPIVKGVVGAFLAFKTISKVTSVFKTVTTGVKGMITTFKKVQGAIRFATSAFNLFSPVKLIIAGVILVGILLYKNWDTIKEKAHELHAKVSEKWNAIKTACEPVVNAIKAGWEGVKTCWNTVKTAVGDMVDKAVEKWNAMKNKCKEVVDDISQKWETLKTVFAHPIQATVSFIKNGDLSGVETGGSKVDGVHKTGLTRVPYDNYTAKLHEGERVLTKQETDLLDQGKLGANNGGSSQPIQINIANMNVREESDINKIATALARIIKNDGLNYA